jgi:hypothetical protein
VLLGDAGEFEEDAADLLVLVGVCAVEERHQQVDYEEAGLPFGDTLFDEGRSAGISGGGPRFPCG